PTADPVTITGTTRALPPGSLVTVGVTGTSLVLMDDVDPYLSGVQARVGNDGKFTFRVDRPSGPGVPTFTAYAVNGAAATSVTSADVLSFRLANQRHFDFDRALEKPVEGNIEGYLSVLSSSTDLGSTLGRYSAKQAFGWV